MGDISGEADELEEADILAVCLDSYSYRGVQNINISRTISWIDFKFEQNVAEGVP